jgi:hypothetical protein
MSLRTPIILLLASVMATACRGAAPAPAANGYTPGLGEIMSLQQMRHTKLWFAGQNANWLLADYELKELKEGFDDAVAMHPADEEFPLPVKDLVPKKVTVPLQDLAAAIKAQNAGKFDAAFDALTTACNECHQAENFGFNVIQRPTSNPYANQQFTP